MREIEKWVFARYVKRNGKIYYPRNGKYFRFPIYRDKEIKN